MYHIPLLIRFLFFLKGGYLRFDHNWGGGSEKVAQLWIEDNLDKPIVQVRKVSRRRYSITFRHGGKHASITCRRPILHLVLNLLDIKKIIVGQLAGYDLIQICELITFLREENSCELIYYWNDCYSVCPTFFLLDSNGQYCAGGGDNCKKCYPKIASSQVKSQFSTIDDWRKQWGDLFKYVDEIRVFSNYSADFAQSFFPDFRGLVTHEVMPMSPISKATLRVNKNEPYNVAVLGIIGTHKGFNVLRNIDKLLQSTALPLKFHIYGSLEESLSNFIDHGRYVPEDLPQKLADDEIDLIFIPSICAETYCITAQEAILMGVPVASFGIGAHAERVSRYGKGLILHSQEAENVCCDIIKFIKNI